MREGSKQVPTGSYLYLERQLEKFMTRFNMRVGPVRTQITNTQVMNNPEMGTEKIPNSHVYSSYKIESKIINTDESESRVCYTDESR